MEGLTERVLAYQRTSEGLCALIEEISPRVYRYPRFKLGWDEDACSEFYLYFHPRLIRILSRFRDQGKPFESYLCSAMSWQLKNFARERRKAERGWRVSLRLGMKDEEGAEASTDDASIIQEAIKYGAEGTAGRRNLLLLGLKCLRGITAPELAALSRLTGASPEELSRHVGSLMLRLEPRERRLEKHRQKRNHAFCQIQSLEAELCEEIDPERRQRILCRLSRARKRMKNAIERMSRVMLAPTNRELAEVLGIPKGTVDSGLYWLKRQLGVVYYREDDRQSA